MHFFEQFRTIPYRFCTILYDYVVVLYDYSLWPMELIVENNDCKLLYGGWKLKENNWLCFEKNEIIPYFNETLLALQCATIVILRSIFVGNSP